MAFDLSKALAGVRVDTAGKEQIEYIGIDRLQSDPNNFYELSGLDELASNIALCGLQQPIRVRQMPDGNYVIISGHRRRAALELLIGEGREDLRDVPCIVETGEEDSDLTQLKLIMANADTRKISAADQAKQAEQVEKLLYSLQQKGYEFPGRMRDHVAAVCKISTGKLATLKKVKTNLVPQLRKLWEANEINMATAEALANLTPFKQGLIFERQTKSRGRLRINASWVESIAREMSDIERNAVGIVCMERPKCDHVPVRIAQAAGLGQYNGLHCRGCCCTCWDLGNCTFSCPDAAKDKQRLKDDAKAKKQAEKAAQEAKDAPKRNMLAEGYARLGRMMQQAGVDTEKYVITSTGFRMLGEIEKTDKLIAGGRPQLTNRMPGGIWPDEAEKLGATADLLGCTIDYLLCHSDTPQPAGWQTGEPHEPGKYVTIRRYRKCKAESVDSIWDGTAWRDYDNTALDDHEVVLMWQPWPEEIGNEP